MVAPFGCHPIREAPLRTRGTRRLPESGMPHRSSLIHQVWRSHCNTHTHTQHCYLQTIMLLGLSGTITFALWWFTAGDTSRITLINCDLRKALQSTRCLCLIPVRAKIKHVNKNIYAIRNWCAIRKHEAVIFDYIITERKINWARAFLSSGATFDQSAVHPSAVKRLLLCNAVKKKVWHKVAGSGRGFNNGRHQ